MPIETFAAQPETSMSTPLAAAKAVAPIVRTEAEAGEKQRHLTDCAVESMKKAGLYKLMLPRSLGGDEADPVTVLQVIEEISRADGSAGWCLMGSNLEAGAAAAFLGEDAVKTIFGNRIDVVMSGQGLPRARALPENGGYWLSGQFSYGSGIAHAEYIHTGAIVMEGERPRLMPDGNPEMRIFHVPRHEIELGDNWHVLGLRGTGSFDYTLTDTYQPESYSYLLEEQTPKRGGNLYRLGLIGFTALGHTAFALGVGRRALEEIATLAAAKENLFGRVGDAPSFQEKFALAEAKMRAARSYCIEVWGNVTQTLEEGNTPSVQQTALLRLGLRHVHDVVSEICTFAYRAGGGTSLRESTLQRCYRDIHAATQHILVSDQLVQDCGKALLGLVSADAKWTIGGLV